MTPKIFLNLLKLTPFLPPREASVIANKVVGINPNLTPRI